MPVSVSRVSLRVPRGGGVVKKEYMYVCRLCGLRGGEECGVGFCFCFCSVNGCVYEGAFSIREEMRTEGKTTESIHIVHLRARIMASV